MPIRKKSFFIPFILGALMLAAGLLLLSTSKADAQCGSQASSCKNCHEVQGKDPVNNDGTGWHESHAFGDFCYICHAGNNQSMDEATAHTGMVEPLSDPKAACQSCHPSDLDARVKVYADKLGIQAGSGGATPAATQAGASTTPAAPAGSGSTGGTTGGSGAAPSGESSGSEIVVDSQQNVVDYTQRYNETVLGQRKINWGNVILVVLILFVAVGGGAFVYWNERKLRGKMTMDGGRRTEAAPVGSDAIIVPGYSAEVTALLPKIAELNPAAQHALKRLLENPAEASELLISLSYLDPDLVRRIRSLDRDSRDLLLALAGD
jgi:hypothetical protein